MNIRLAAHNEIDDLKSIWRSCFDDEAQFIDHFFHLLFHPSRCLVGENNGRVVSMIHLLEGEVCIDGSSTPLYYLFACATLPEEEGKGWMSRLLEEADQLALSRGIGLLTLVAATDSLVSFYTKRGYSVTKDQPTSPSPSHQKQHQSSLSFQTLTPEGLHQWRREMADGRPIVQWPIEHLTLVLGSPQSENNKAIAMHSPQGKGYVVYSFRKESLFVLEISEKGLEKETMIEALLAMHTCQNDETTPLCPPIPKPFFPETRAMVKKLTLDVPKFEQKEIILGLPMNI